MDSAQSKLLKDIYYQRLETKSSVLFKTLTNTLIWFPAALKIVRYAASKTRFAKSRWLCPASFFGCLGLNAVSFGLINHYVARREFNNRTNAMIDTM